MKHSSSASWLEALSTSTSKTLHSPTLKGAPVERTKMSDVNIIEELAGVRPGSPLAQTLLARMDIMDLSQASYDAIIQPREPGGLSHAERAALAARMARHNADET